MISPHRLAVPLAAWLLASPVRAQEREEAPAQLARPRPNALAAAGTGLLVNLFINRVDAWLLGQDWARVSPATWRRNIRLGWEWDEDAFTVNMFSHPYHGSLYFNAGRAYGLDFWGSAPLAFLGSWTWERFGETFRPSLNDFFMTSLGGIALGEVTHRLAALLRDDRTPGAGRMLRDLAALPLDPVGGLRHFATGHRAPEPVAPPPPGTLRVLAAAGPGVISESGSLDRPSASSTIMAELAYGDAFEREYQAPFDVFTLQAVVRPNAGGLGVLRARGRLYAREITPAHVISRHQLTISQKYEYLNNPAYSFGGQSVELGLASQHSLPRQVRLLTLAAVEAIILGAADAPGAGVGERSYDFGPGLGVIAEGALVRGRRTLARAFYRSSYIHSVSGADAEHFTHFVGLEGTVPLPAGFGIGAHGGYYLRASSYRDAPSESRRFPESRLFVAWGAQR